MINFTSEEDGLEVFSNLEPSYFVTSRRNDKVAIIEVKDNTISFPDFLCFCVEYDIILKAHSIVLSYRVKEEYTPDYLIYDGQKYRTEII